MYGNMVARSFTDEHIFKNS